LALTLVILGGAWLLRPRPDPIVVITPEPTLPPTPTLTPTPALLRVYVSGAVAQPDVYVLARGALVKDALAAAGGPAVDADLARINLAVELGDQQHVHVPRQGETPVPMPTSATASTESDAPAALLDINSATAQELEALPNIGPAIAARIVAYREEFGPFETVQDLTDVSGIGPATLAKIEDRITVR
jgi:competence protein ComEA